MKKTDDHHRQLQYMYIETLKYVCGRFKNFEIHVAGKLDKNKIWLKCSENDSWRPSSLSIKILLVD